MSAENWTDKTAYEPLEELSITDLAFEFLRRNHSYRADYRLAQSQTGAAATRLAGKVSADPAERWRLVFFSFRPIVPPLFSQSSGGRNISVLRSF